MTEVPLEAVLEGTLFAAGRGMTLDELAEGLGYPIEEIEDCRPGAAREAAKHKL